MSLDIKKIYENKAFRVAVIVILSFMAAVSVWKGCVNAYTYSQDFQWDAAKALSMGINPYDESMSPSGKLNQGELGDFYRRFEELGAPQKMEANQFPSLLMLLLPMTFLSPDMARICWIILNLFFAAAIIYLLKVTFLKDTDKFTTWVLSLLMLAGTPFRNQLGVGQHTLFAFAFFMLAVWFCDVKDCPLGTTLSLFVSYFKYTLTAPLVIYFIYKRKIKEVVISVLMHAFLTVVSAIMLKDSVVNMIIKPLKVASVLSSEGGIDLGAVFSGAAISFILAGAIALMLLVMAIVAPKGCGKLIFAVALLWSLILTYHRTYDFFVLSAAGCILSCGDEMPLSDKKSEFAKYVLFGLTVITSYFVLRVFSENFASKMLLGIEYYALTILMTGILYKYIKDNIGLKA